MRAIMHNSEIVVSALLCPDRQKRGYDLHVSVLRCSSGLVIVRLGLLRSLIRHCISGLLVLSTDRIGRQAFVPDSVRGFHLRPAALRRRPPAGNDRWLNIWMTLAVSCMQGTFFSDHKWRGGLQLIGLVIVDYIRFRGFLKKRCQWIISSIKSMESAGGW